EKSYPHITDLVKFVKTLKQDELTRLLGSEKYRQMRVISTIHKVKGLEYDHVIMLPSKMNFAIRKQGGMAVVRDAAEEARLYYVGMTRAKSGLYRFVGDREYAWAKSRPFDSTEQDGGARLLLGSHDE